MLWVVAVDTNFNLYCLFLNLSQNPYSHDDLRLHSGLEVAKMICALGGLSFDHSEYPKMRYCPESGKL
jgi:hypothetical protein